MATWAWVLLVYGVSAPVALAWARNNAFLPAGDPILAFRIPAGVWIASAIALVALGSAVGWLVATALDARPTADALAWWRRPPGDATR